jgi:NAD(P)-dependent dehydrogenase (short-subunit alcohol dehydrogenase family)
MAAPARRKTLITGAAGGMGRACARLFGATQDLVLTDAIQPALERFAAELTADGYTITAARAGDLGSSETIAALTADLAGDLPFTVIHTAGLSPALAGARAIMDINLVTTAKLLDAIEPILRPGTAAVLIASMSAYMMPEIPDAKALMANPLATDFLDKIMALIDGMSPSPANAPGISYTFSKQAVIAQVERRALAWGQRGARITSISPGIILTPMGRKELAETAGAAQLNDAAPAGRSGTAADIALAAHFLASDNASFISGCDLRVDGGATAVTRMR